MWQAKGKLLRHPAVQQLMNAASMQQERLARSVSVLGTVEDLAARCCEEFSSFIERSSPGRGNELCCRRKGMLVVFGLEICMLRRIVRLEKELLMWDELQIFLRMAGMEEGLADTEEAAELYCPPEFGCRA